MKKTKEKNMKQRNFSKLRSCFTPFMQINIKAYRNGELAGNIPKLSPKIQIDEQISFYRRNRKKIPRAFPEKSTRPRGPY